MSNILGATVSIHYLGNEEYLVHGQIFYTLGDSHMQAKYTDRLRVTPIGPSTESTMNLLTTMVLEGIHADMAMGLAVEVPPAIEV